MLSLQFEGWFQCRLATNPDPSDEPRGVSGTTFAVAGEPDLDGVIRLHHPVAPRSHGPVVGVQTVGVTVDGVSMQNHPLLGAKVDLLGQPKFEERNGIIANMGEAPINPFKIEVTGQGVTLRREDLWDPWRPALKMYQVPPEVMKKRQPLSSGPGLFVQSSVEVADATGIADFPQYFADRKKALENEYRQTQDPVVQVALLKRIAEIDIGGWLRHFRLGFRVVYGFEINGQPEVIGEENLAGRVLKSQYWLPYWPIRFWMGGFDTDALCAYMRGTLDIPFAPNRPARGPGGRQP